MATANDITHLDSLIASALSDLNDSVTTDRVNRFVSNYKLSLDNISNTIHTNFKTTLIGVYRNIGHEKVVNNDYNESLKSLLRLMVDSYYDLRK